MDPVLKESKQKIKWKMRKIKTIPKLEEKKEEPGAPSANAV